MESEKLNTITFTISLEYLEVVRLQARIESVKTWMACLTNCGCKDEALYREGVRELNALSAEAEKLAETARARIEQERKAQESELSGTITHPFNPDPKAFEGVEITTNVDPGAPTFIAAGDDKQKFDDEDPDPAIPGETAPDGAFRM